MGSNVGPYDQLIRIIIGVAAGWEVILEPAQGWWLSLLSFGFLMSGVLGFCPVYKLMGGLAALVDSLQSRAAHPSGPRSCRRLSAESSRPIMFKGSNAPDNGNEECGRPAKQNDAIGALHRAENSPAP